MNKDHVLNELSSYLDNELSETEKQKAEEHIRTCSSCAKELAHLKFISEKLKEWKVPEASPFFEQVIKNEIASERQERGVVKMKKKTLTTLIPAGVMAGILVFVTVGYLLKQGVYQSVLSSKGNVPAPIIQANKPAIGAQTNAPVVATPVIERKEKLLMRASTQGLDKSSVVMSAYAARDKGLALSYGAAIVGCVSSINGVTRYAAGEFNTEQYDRIYESEFLKATDNPLSTFSIDVDTASYSNVRRFLNNNQMPPKDAVRIEEMINYFTYDYPQPQNNEPFSVTTEMGACPWNNKHKLLLVGLQGKVMDTQNLPPSNLVFLLDVSGSMADANKLPLVKSAFRLLVDKLRPEDKVSIVVYASSSEVVLDSISGSDKMKIQNAIDNLQAGGSTAGGAGIQLAYEIAKKNYIKGGNNRVILATDGDFNTGVSSDSEMVRLIEEKRNDGIFLTILGFGMGNYKDAKMEKLADKGNGNAAYIDNLLEAKKVFITQLTGTLYTIAKDVKIQIEFNPAKVKAYRLIGYENRLLKKEDFNDDKKDAGELGAGHSVTALYEIVTADSEEEFGKTDPLKYQKTVIEPSDELLTVKLRYKEPAADESRLISKKLSGADIKTSFSENLNFASAVAEFGMILRGSQYKGSASYQDAIDRAKASKGKDEFGYRAEFIRLTEIAQLLDTKK